MKYILFNTQIERLLMISFCVCTCMHVYVCLCMYMFLCIFVYMNSSMEQEKRSGRIVITAECSLNKFCGINTLFNNISLAH